MPNKPHQGSLGKKILTDARTEKNLMANEKRAQKKTTAVNRENDHFLKRWIPRSDNIVFCA